LESIINPKNTFCVGSQTDLSVMYAQLYYRITEVEKSKSLKLSKENYDSKMICIRKGKM
jgi:hypothetical protein